MRRSTHSLATLEISIEAWNEIAKKLDEAGYNCFIKTGTQIIIDMNGIGLIPHTQTEEVPVEGVHIEPCSVCLNLTTANSEGEFICYYCGSNKDLGQRDKNYLIENTDVKF